MDDYHRPAVRRVDDPHVEDSRDAVVAVRKAAICGSDLHVLDGRIPGMPLGGVLGHEFTGTVRAVGDAVSGLTPGDRVVGAFLIPCGSCTACGRSDYNQCEDLRLLGYGAFFGDLPGAQAEYVRVPNADLTLMRIPEALSDEQILFAGDILATALYANRLGRVGRGTAVAVQGCGPLGLLTIEVARSRGADPIVAVDPVSERLELARDRGAQATINPSRSSPGVAIEAPTDGQGADVVLDTAGGTAAVLTQTFDLVRAGGTVAVVGVYSDPEATIPLGELFVRGITLAFGGTCPVQALWHEAVGLVEDGGVDPTGLISHRLALADAVTGYELFASREATKVVLDVGVG